MKKLSLIALALLLGWGTSAQELPQFSYNDYEGWTYNNPGVELNADNIGRSNIRLYIDSQGLVLTLTSPEFSCSGLDSIQADVRWLSESSTVSLTMALDDAEGTPLDSATCLPSSQSSNQRFAFTVPVPRGLSVARVCFVSWNADVSTSGAVRIISLTGVVTQSQQTPAGDVDGDNKVSISDVTALINYLLSKDSSGINTEGADFDGDSRVNINDVTALINWLLTPHH